MVLQTFEASVIDASEIEQQTLITLNEALISPSDEASVSPSEEALISPSDETSVSPSDEISVSPFLHTNQNRLFPVLLGINGEEVEFPEKIHSFLQILVHHLLAGESVELVPLNKDLSTFEAAKILNVSRPYLIKLLDNGTIPSHKTGSHRRILASDVREYRMEKLFKREQTLSKMALFAKEMGTYTDFDQTDSSH